MATLKELSEPTQEEIEATAAFKREQLKKEEKRFQLVGLGSLIVLVSISIGSILYFGYTQLKILYLENQLNYYWMAIG